MQPLVLKNEIIDFADDIGFLNKMLVYEIFDDEVKKYVISSSDYIAGYFVEIDNNNNPTGRKIKFNSVVDKILKNIDLSINDIDSRIDNDILSESSEQYLISELLSYKKYKERVEKIKKNFISYRPTKAISDKDFYIVISRAAEDIAGMSTDRRWTSCMHLPGYINSKGELTEGGMHYDILENDVRLGTLVAYLIDKEDYDKKEIDNPWARIAIKPWFEKETNNYILVPEPKAYTDTSLLKSIVDNFSKIVSEFFNNVNKDIEGIFEFDKRNLYFDDPNAEDPTNKYFIKNKEHEKYIHEIFQLLDNNRNYSIDIMNIIKNNIFKYYFKNGIDWFISSLHQNNISKVYFEFNGHNFYLECSSIENTELYLNKNEYEYDIKIEGSMLNCKVTGESTSDIEVNTVTNCSINNKNLKLTVYKVFENSSFENGLYSYSPKTKAKEWSDNSTWINGSLYSMVEDKYINVKQNNSEIFNVEVFNPKVFASVDNNSNNLLENALKSGYLIEDRR